MPGPYYDHWKGPSLQHPSNAATREEIESLQTVEDVQRMFPDLEPPPPAGHTHRYVLAPGGGLRKEDHNTTPEEATLLHVRSARAFNPYTCEAWFVIWTRQGAGWKQPS
jgi:hypothetical protein